MVKLQKSIKNYMGSSIWPFLHSAYGKIMFHFRWIVVGKGDRICFWHDNWIGSPIVNFDYAFFHCI